MTTDDDLWERVGESPSASLPVYLAFVERLSDVTAEHWPKAGFSLCLMGETLSCDDSFRAFAHRALEHGIVYFAACGAGAEECHDAFDLLAQESYEKGHPVIM